MGDGNVPQIISPEGTPLVRTAAARAPRETIATCPRCGGEIRGNSRAYGCSSWKSRKNPGCGFVIWKSMKGREITAEEAKLVIEQGSTGPLEFRDRQGSFVGRLVLTDDKSVEVVRADSESAAA
jgi:DNA topoisomerase-3